MRSCKVSTKDRWVLPISPWLNIYCIPKELDHPNKVIKHQNSFRLDNMIHANLMNEQIPEEMQKFIDDSSGSKLVYVSLGTVACADLTLIKKLVKILSRSKHRFIVAKGPRHSEYELAHNMWGDRYLPQKSVLKKVDLFITHGGNNSLTEAFSLGVPMIVLPVWMDAVDNALRLHELGYGIRLDPVSFTDEQLLTAVDKLLKDCELRLGLKMASKRIMKENRIEMAAQLIETIQA